MKAYGKIVFDAASEAPLTFAAADLADALDLVSDDHSPDAPKDVALRFAAHAMRQLVNRINDAGSSDRVRELAVLRARIRALEIKLDELRASERDALSATAGRPRAFFYE